MEHQALHRPRATPQPQIAQMCAGPEHGRLAGLAHQLNTGPAVQRIAAMAPDRGGLPTGLRAGIEALSGVSMAGVRVHRNSSKPAQLQAQAYAQGKDIHLAPGREHHLPHEAWHIVQQAQGRVKPTMQMKGDVPVNDDAGLEREADAMGARAMSAPVQQKALRSTNASQRRPLVQRKAMPVQFGKPKRKRAAFRSNVNRMRAHGKKVLKGAGFDMAHRMSYHDIDSIVHDPKTSKKHLRGLMRAVAIPRRDFGGIKKGDRQYYNMVRKARKDPEELVRLLNSSPYNLRPGNSSRNRSIGKRGDLHYENVAQPPATPKAKPKLVRSLTPQSRELQKYILENRGESSDFMSKGQFDAFEKGLDRN